VRLSSHHKFSGGGVCFLVQNRVVVKSRVERMSVDSRRIEKVFSVMQGIAAAGDGLVRVGAIADVLREENAPCQPGSCEPIAARSRTQAASPWMQDLGLG